VIPSALIACAVSTVLLLITAALLLLPLDNDYRALWFGAAMDACHVPLFGLLTWCLGKYCWPDRQLAVIGFAAAIACCAEIIQPYVGRSASWRDLAYGLIGIAIATVWLRSSWSVVLRLALIAILLSWPAERTGPVLIDACWAWWSFPVLVGDQGTFEQRRWILQNVNMTRYHDAARLTFGANEHGSSAILLPVIRDWTAYQTLDVNFAFEGDPLVLLISVRDGKRLPPELPRFDLWQRYLPGNHHVRIDLSELVWHVGVSWLRRDSSRWSTSGVMIAIF
jgi:hypothetical protein